LFSAAVAGVLIFSSKGWRSSLLVSRQKPVERDAYLT